jgi:hypothetical protein
MEHNTHSDGLSNLILISMTFILSVFGNFISDIDIYLGVLTKIISILSFALFIFINWGKIKERVNEVLKYLGL